MASWKMLAEKKSKRGSTMYLENHRQVKEAVTKKQLARKDHIGDKNLDFRCLLGRTWARRVIVITIQIT